MDIKSLSVIFYHEIGRLSVGVQRNPYIIRIGVLGDVGEGFLQEAVERNCGLLGER